MNKPYDTTKILRQNVADLEMELKRQRERADKAEAELKAAREQEPVAHVKYKAVGGNVGLSWIATPTDAYYPREGEELYTRPVPAPAVPDANPVQWLEDEGDNILVPRGLLGAACSAIENKRQADKVLAALRHYTQSAAPAVPHSGNTAITKHPTHVTRCSDSSSYDEKCINCGATDIAGGGWGELAKPCQSPAVSEDWRDVMAELAADLQASIEAEHAYRNQYSSVMRKYQNDMRIVERARAMLQSAEARADLQSFIDSRDAWMARANAAEAELKAAREQEPIKYLYRVTDCFGHDVLRDDPKGATILETIPLYASPIPAPAAPREYHEFASVMLDAQPFITAETYGGRYIVAMRFERLGKMQDCHAALLALLQSDGGGT